MMIPYATFAVAGYLIALAAMVALAGLDSKEDER